VGPEASGREVPTNRPFLLGTTQWSGDSVDSIVVDEIAPEPSEEVRVGVFAVRVWVEPHRPDRLRAQITSSLDLSSDETTVTPAEGDEAIVRALRNWLDGFMPG
jgi:hypothetical protein